MENVRMLEDIIRKLPAELKKEVEDFALFLLKKIKKGTQEFSNKCCGMKFYHKYQNKVGKIKYPIRREDMYSNAR